jgi:hypothetical protein
MPTQMPRQENVAEVIGEYSRSPQQLDTTNELSVAKLSMMENDRDGEAVPIDISAKDFLSAVSPVQYRHLQVMANREYIPDTLTNRTRSHAENTTKKSVHREPRFRFFLFKGSKQLNIILETYKPTSIPKDFDMNSFLYEFYAAIFHDEDTEIQKICDDNEMWHLVLVGYRPLTVEERTSSKKVSLWRIIAAVSFKPSVEDVKCIYLAWLAVSVEKATWELWFPGKPEAAKDPVKLFFDGKQFNDGKGLGTTMMACMQHVCKMIVSGRSSNATQDDVNVMETIYCQSNEQSLRFYKVGLCMIEQPTTDHFPPWIKDAFIESFFLYSVRLQGRILDLRPPDIGSENMQVRKAIRSSIVLCYQVSPVEGDQFVLVDKVRSQISLEDSLFYQPKNVKFDKQEFIILSTSDGIPKYKTNQRVTKETSYQLLKQKFRFQEGEATLISVPAHILGLCLVKILAYELIMSSDEDVFQKVFAKKGKELPLLDSFFDTEFNQLMDH